MDTSNNPPYRTTSITVPTTPETPLRIELVQGSRWGKWITRIAVAVAIFCLIGFIGLSAQQAAFFNSDAKLTEKNVRLSGATDASVLTITKKVATIEVEGAIMHQDGFPKAQIDQIRDDDDIIAVVLRVDSPGGTVTGSHYLWHQLKQLRSEKKIPLVVSMGGICASGGYYISMATGNEEDTIWAEPTTWTGSIGVILPHYDLSALLKKWDIKDDSFMSNPLKAAGSMTREMTDEQRKIFQDLIDESFADFKAIVKTGRPKLTDEQLTQASTGQIFTAKQALKLGLIDKIGFLEDAVAQAAKLAGETDPKSYRAVRYSKPTSLFGDASSLFGQASTPPDSLGRGLQQLQTMTTPRLYYLWPAALPTAE
jgi:protease-4